MRLFCSPCPKAPVCAHHISCLCVFLIMGYVLLDLFENFSNRDSVKGSFFPIMKHYLPHMVSPHPYPSTLSLSSFRPFLSPSNALCSPQSVTRSPPMNMQTAADSADGRTRPGPAQYFTGNICYHGNISENDHATLHP